MSIYSTPLSQLGTADLAELLQERAIENIRLEFKSEVPGKENTLKKLSSFANTFGGYMVVGAKAQSKDGRIEDLPGVDEVSGYKQKIVDWCFKDVSPPLIVDVSGPIPAPSGNGKVCYVIYIGESESTPHFLNGRKGIWIRTDEFSANFNAQLADEAELQQLFNRRQLVLERRANLLARARKRFGTYAARQHTDLGGNLTKIGPILELCAVPRFPARSLCTQEQLPRLVSNKRIEPFRQISFPRWESKNVSQYESVITEQPLDSLSLLEANIWGMLFYATTVEEPYNLAGTDTGIHLYEFVGRLLIFLRHAGESFQALNFSGPILIETSLTSIRNAQWFHQPPGPIGAHYLKKRPASGLDDDFAMSLTSTSDELRQNTDDLAMTVLRSLFFSLNWFDAVNTQEKIENLVRRGHSFNDVSG